MKPITVVVTTSLLCAALSGCVTPVYRTSYANTYPPGYATLPYYYNHYPYINPYSSYYYPLGYYYSSPYWGWRHGRYWGGYGGFYGGHAHYWHYPY